jgi:hypothetical protein
MSKNVMLKCFSILTLICFSVSICTAAISTDEDRWKLESESDGIKVYTGKKTMSGMVEYRGVSRDRVRIEEVADILLDIPGYTSWGKYISESRVINKTDENHFIVYQRYNFLWPTHDRDIVVSVVITRDYRKGMLRAVMTAVDDDSVPRREDCVRITEMRSVIEVRYVNREETEGSFTGLFNPGGHIPVWLANAVGKYIPSTVLKKLREMIAKGDKAEPTAVGRDVKRGIERAIAEGYLEE